MTDQQEQKKPAAAAKGEWQRRYGGRTPTGRVSGYKSKVDGLKYNTFDVGASSDPAKYSKSLKSIETYIQKSYKRPDYIVKALQNMSRLQLSPPTKPSKADHTDENGNPDKDLFDMAVYEWKEAHKDYLARKKRYQDNESNAWALLYDQCLPELKNKLKGTKGYDAAKDDNDIIELMKMVRSYCCQFDTLNDEYMSIVGAIKNLFFFWQKPDQANADYHEDFMALVKVIKEYGGAGSISYFPNMIRKEVAKSTELDKTKANQEAKKIVRDKFLAALMLNGANQQKYGDLKRGMAENYVTGTSEYPDSPEMVLRILSAYKPLPGWNKRRGQDAGATSEEGAMFAQTEGDDSWKESMTCFKYQEKGHLARECPTKKSGGSSNEQIHANIEESNQGDKDDLDQGENIFVQSQMKGVVNRNFFVLLDNQSTVDQVANPGLLSNIRKSAKPITVHCNSGSTYTNMEGDLGTWTVKHNLISVANVLSLKSAKERNKRVTYDSWDRGRVFKVHTHSGAVVEFKPSEKGLHYLDVTKEDNNFKHMLVNTVRDNFEGFIKHEVEKATEARRLQRMIGNPTGRE